MSHYKPQAVFLELGTLIQIISKLKIDDIGDRGGSEIIAHRAAVTAGFP